MRWQSLCAGKACTDLRLVALLMQGMLTLVPSTPRSASHLSSTSRLKTQGRASANTVTADCRGRATGLSALRRHHQPGHDLHASETRRGQQCRMNDNAPQKSMLLSCRRMHTTCSPMCCSEADDLLICSCKTMSPMDSQWRR